MVLSQTLKPEVKKDVISQLLAGRHLKELSLDKEISRVFITTADVKPREHILMQAAWQKWIDNSVSKTVNLPASATIEDVAQVYMMAWKTGCKGVTVYRDGSKEKQVVDISKSQTEIKDETICPECGSQMVISEGCMSCPVCGYSVCKG